ncbi:MAG: glycosyltransferase family 4 protein [Myxococcales bacterium]|nr:glycosyltransferase family 4 protein [Myxococcales bacterium]
MLLLGLTSLCSAPGGIPAFNRLLCRAAAEWAEAHGEQVRVLVLCDEPAGRVGQDVPPGYQAFGGHRMRFSAALAAALIRCPMLCLGHVHLAPLGLLSPRGFGVVAHGTEVWSPLPRLRRFALRRARVVACVSRHTAGCVQQMQGVEPERCLRVINALDPASFADVLTNDVALPAADQPGGRPLEVFSLTRLQLGEPKGIDLMLHAVARLPELRYTVAGEGDALPGLRALAARLGVSERVRFLGRVTDAERANLLAGCDVFALPSSGEGFGIVYLEAMAHGKPCIAARAGGAPEVVLDGETGLVVPAQTDALVEALRRLMDPGLRARLGAAGRARVRAQFCYPQFREHAFALFDRLATLTPAHWPL